MFTRVVEIRTKSGRARDFSTALHDKVLPILQKQPGFLDEITLVSNIDPDRVLALSFWRTEADADRYNREQFPTVKDVLSSVLDHAPQVSTYDVDTSTTHKIMKGKAA
jgi:heme-degrading monooxygenase HmoA